MDLQRDRKGQGTSLKPGIGIVTALLSESREEDSGRRMRKMALRFGRRKVGARPLLLKL